jgi:MFS family permease
MSSHAGPSSTGPRGNATHVAAHRHAAGFGLVLVMAAGSIVMWLISPVAWLFVASRITDSSQPSLGPYLLVLVGIVLTAVVVGKFLGIVNRAHMRVTGRLADRREHATWNRSLRGERKPVNDRGVLEQVMLVSVGCALLAFGIWFFGFAGSSLPS